MIVCFTGTGNSGACARILADVLEDRVLDANAWIKEGKKAELSDGKAWVFVCPTYAWQIPHVFADFIENGSFEGSRDVYFLMTCGDDIGGAAEQLRVLCKAKGFRFRGVLPVIMPENYIALFKVPEREEAETIVQKAIPAIREAAEQIRSGLSFPSLPVSPADRIKSGIVNRFFYRFVIRAKPFYVQRACTGCGLCRDKCVMNNIRMENGRPVWGDVCTHCMACICCCPHEAIEYGKRTAGKVWYRCPPCP